MGIVGNNHRWVDADAGQILIEIVRVGIVVVDENNVHVQRPRLFNGNLRIGMSFVAGFLFASDAVTAFTAN